MLSRKTLCLASQAPGFTLHDGDDIFLSSVSHHYSSAENDAAEKLMRLKRTVASLPTDQFWRVLLPGIADILQAEYIIISKRILPDDPNSVVEMPAIGEPGSCFNAVAFYINDGKNQEFHTDYSYLTMGGACAQMRYDKVFLAPSALAAYMPTRVAEFKSNPESYIGIPLFYQDKCFGHIAVIWSDQSSFKDSGLTWGFTEMILHALEDIVAQRLLEGSTLQPPSPAIKAQNVIPQSAIVATQSLKPYARSLSHELRTPMQTMVGGMDLIGASLDDILGSTNLEEALKQIQKARDLIDEFQDSSRRAVRAADNVVQAYDLDMQVPDRPLLLEEESEEMPVPPLLLEQDSGNFANFAAKRKRVGDESTVKISKQRVTHHSRKSSVDVLRARPEHSTHTSIEGGLGTPGNLGNLADNTETNPSTPVMGLVEIRPFVRSEVSDVVNHTDSTTSSITIVPQPLGEHIQASFIGPNGAHIHKTLVWEVQESVPSEIVVEEKELAKTFTAVLANALKFTENGGRISIDIRLSPKLRYVVFTIKDNGCGIPESFQPRIFQAFSREDESITRHSEGLGLGLLVAKGNARKMGGDLYLRKSATEGPEKGSHFELKIPICPFDSFSRQETPSRPSTPGRIDIPPTPADLENGPTSAPRLEHGDLKLALDHNQDVVDIPAQLLTPGTPVEEIVSVVPQARTSTKKIVFNRGLGTKYPHKILVAEDSSLNRKLAVNMLKKLGYSDILEAFDGQEAVRLMEQAALDNEEISIILMDLWMPNMDGYEAAQKILAMQQLKGRQQRERELKILAVTADITDTALGRAREVGMVGYMTKPFKVIDLERLIVEHSQPAVNVT